MVFLTALVPSDAFAMPVVLRDRYDAHFAAVSNQDVASASTSLPAGFFALLRLKVSIARDLLPLDLCCRLLLHLVCSVVSLLLSLLLQPAQLDDSDHHFEEGLRLAVLRLVHHQVPV